MGLTTELPGLREALRRESLPVQMAGKLQHLVTAGLLHFSPMGGTFFDDQWEPRFAEEPGVRAAKVPRTIAEIGPPGTAAFGFGEMLNAFLQGLSAMYLDTIAVFGPARYPKASRVVGKVSYLPHPAATRASSETGGFGMVIPRNSANKEAAFAFIQWMTSKAQDKRLALAGGVAALRTVFVLPMMIAPICVGLIWRYLFDTSYGPINQMLRPFGLEQTWFA